MVEAVTSLARSSINAKAIRPDLTIFLDLPAERARQRIQGTRWTEDIYESIEQQRQVREIYHSLIDQHIPILGPIVRVDASQPKERVLNVIKHVVAEFYQTGAVDQSQHELGLFA